MGGRSGLVDADELGQWTWSLARAISQTNAWLFPFSRADSVDGPEIFRILEPGSGEDGRGRSKLRAGNEEDRFKPGGMKASVPRG